MNRLDVLYAGLVVITAPWWARKVRHGWAERFGHVAPIASDTEPHAGDAPRKPRVMLHAVSVGEVHALRELVPMLVDHAQVIVTCTTDTGMARAEALFGGSCHVVRYPVDFSSAVRRFLDAIRPDVVGLVELEVWPNFIAECRRRGIPVGVINGRLSARSFRGYRRIRPWIRRSFASLDFAAVQDQTYAQRFKAMGVNPEVCTITNSMKWDAAYIRDSVEGAETLAAEMGIDRDRLLIVAGSTAEGEESLFHAACPPGAQLLCAPRKPERFEQAAQDLPNCIRRSAKRPGKSDRFLLDTIGELDRAYALADLVIIGRSFGKLYGSDPIGPAALGKPVVAGPAMGDFESLVAPLEQCGGLVRVKTEDLQRVLADLIEDSERRHEMGERNQSCVRANQGASARHAEIVMRACGEPGR